MRPYFCLGLLALGSVLSAAAQTACSPGELGVAARTVAFTRQKLHSKAVAQSDPVVPSEIAGQLAQLKDALALAARATFSCAPWEVSPKQLQTKLADALSANLALAPETSVETRGGKELGVYASDLQVQIFELFGKPRIFEVDFRYGVACGDDHLLLVFEATKDSAPDSWRERLRWDSAQYKTVGDAFGDFVLLTPLTGSYKNPTWHYLVAHGHPGCGDTPRPSKFDLDLLTPTEDPERPTVVWHFQHAYTQGDTVPRLATTEDTIDFQIVPAAPSSAEDKSPDRTRKPLSSPAETYRFHLTASGNVEPSPLPRTDEGSTSAPTASQSSTKN